MKLPSGERPVVGTVIGDPCGIGPEVVAKAWTTGLVHKHSRPVLIGSAVAMEQAVKVAGVRASVRPVRSVEWLNDRPDVIDILDSNALDPRDITVGEDNIACGRASGLWLDEATHLAASDTLAATVMAPISTKAMAMAGMLDRAVSPTLGKTYLLLVSGRLRVAHLTDHMSLRDVCDAITAPLIVSALRLLDDALKNWGIAQPRILVAGLNPHATGEEEEMHIAPAVQEARRLGIQVEGPASPDTVFRHCIESRCDVVLAMFHDQGHIAVKTWGFSGNSVIVLGMPHLHVSVAHGTAYDIVGKGVADPTMMLNAMCMAGYLSGGKGFPILDGNSGL